MPGNYERKDHLYRQAKSEGYRSRAAYKLLELDKRYRLIGRGMRVYDLGCAPGGWLQVAARKVGPVGIVVGIDLEQVKPIPENGGGEVVLVQGDFNDAGLQASLRTRLGGAADVVLSDMSPDISGIKLRDGARSAELVALAWEFASGTLRPGGSFVAKIFPSQECEALAKTLKPHFGKFARPVLDSSRNTSTELYFVGQNFRGQ